MFFYRRGGFGGVLFCHKLSKKLSTNSLRVREFVPAEWFLCCCQDTSSSLIVRGILRSYEKKPEVFRIRIRFFFCLFGSGYGSICIFCFNLLTKDQQQLKPIFSTKKNIYAKTCYVNYYFQHKLSLLWSSGKHKNSKFGVLNIIFKKILGIYLVRICFLAQSGSGSGRRKKSYPDTEKRTRIRNT